MDMRKIIKTALKLMLANVGRANETLTIKDELFMEDDVRLVYEAFNKEVDIPLFDNFKPEPLMDEMMARLAINILLNCKKCLDVILLADADTNTFLEAFCPPDMDDDESIDPVTQETIYTPRPEGTIEYMVCNGLPGDRTSGFSFYNLAEAVECFGDIIRAGGWLEYNQQIIVNYNTMNGKVIKCMFKDKESAKARVAALDKLNSGHRRRSAEKLHNDNAEAAAIRSHFEKVYGETIPVTIPK
jgi:hypothetical protein